MCTSTTPSPNDPLNRKLLDEAVDILLKGMDRLYERFKGEVGSLKDEMNTRFDKVEGRLQRVEAELSFVKDEINGLYLTLLAVKLCRLHPL